MSLWGQAKTCRRSRGWSVSWHSNKLRAGGLLGRDGLNRMRNRLSERSDSWFMATRGAFTSKWDKSNSRCVRIRKTIKEYCWERAARGAESFVGPCVFVSGGMKVLRTRQKQPDRDGAVGNGSPGESKKWNVLTWKAQVAELQTDCLSSSWWQDKLSVGRGVCKNLPLWGLRCVWWTRTVPVL